MTAVELLRVLGYTWAAFGVYWTAAAVTGKAAQKSEFPLYRILRLGILVIAFALLFYQRMASGFLGRRFVPESLAVAYIAFVLALAGLSVAL